MYIYGNTNSTHKDSGICMHSGVYELNYMTSSDVLYAVLYVNAFRVHSPVIPVYYSLRVASMGQSSQLWDNGEVAMNRSFSTAHTLCEKTADIAFTYRVCIPSSVFTMP